MWLKCFFVFFCPLFFFYYVTGSIGGDMSALDKFSGTCLISTSQRRKMVGPVLARTLIGLTLLVSDSMVNGLPTREKRCSHVPCWFMQLVGSHLHYRYNLCSVFMATWVCRNMCIVRFPLPAQSVVACLALWFPQISDLSSEGIIGLTDLNI